mgnify:CR=1 FL=1
MPSNVVIPPGEPAINQNSVHVGNGLPPLTVDRIAKLARLITTQQDTPDANRMTNKVIPAMRLARGKFLNPQMQDDYSGLTDSQPYNLRSDYP